MENNSDDDERGDGKRTDGRRRQKVRGFLLLFLLPLLSLWFGFFRRLARFLPLFFFCVHHRCVRASHLRDNIDIIVNATFSYFSPQGRGFENADIIDDEVKHSRNDRYETLRDGDGERGGQRGQPQKSIEGWVVLVTGVHEEAQEEDIHENFGDFGEISNLHLNLDRRTGFVKGYCLIEYKEKEEAQSAIENMDGKLMLDEEVRVEWAFVNAPEKPSSRRDRR